MSGSCRWCTGRISVLKLTKQFVQFKKPNGASIKSPSNTIKEHHRRLLRRPCERRRFSSCHCFPSAFRANNRSSLLYVSADKNTHQGPPPPRAYHWYCSPHCPCGVPTLVLAHTVEESKSFFSFQIFPSKRPSQCSTTFISLGTVKRSITCTPLPRVENCHVCGLRFQWIWSGSEQCRATAGEKSGRINSA